MPVEVGQRDGRAKPYRVRAQTAQRHISIHQIRHLQGNVGIALLQPFWKRPIAPERARQKTFIAAQSGHHQALHARDLQLRNGQAQPVRMRPDRAAEARSKR